MESSMGLLAMELNLASSPGFDICRMTDFSLGDATHTDLLTPEMEPVTDCANIQIGKPVSFYCSHGNMGKGYLLGSGISEKQLYNQQGLPTWVTTP